MEVYIQRIYDVILNPLIQLMFFIAFIVFAWGVLNMIANAADQAKRSEGKKHMMWGIAGMLIMLLALGI